MDLRAAAGASAAEHAAAAARGLRGFQWRPRYSTSREDLVAEFFKPALQRSRAYDRAVGYFRSSFYSLTGRATAEFALDGGHIRLLCAPELTEQDARAISAGLELRAVLDNAVRRELEQMVTYPTVRETFELLANLVAFGAMDVRFAIWNEQTGLFHDKVGIFTDAAGDSISFSGSINETWRAWHPLGNHESFEVFQSWTGERSRVVDHQTYFTALWDGHEPRVSVYEPPEAFETGFLRFAAVDPEEKLRAVVASRKVQRGRRPFAHQSSALGDWERRGRRGILDHATGSGKTITALNAIRTWISEGKPALVLVPSRLLLEQWGSEAFAELDDLDPSIVLAGGGHDSWRNNSLLRLQTRPGGGSRLTIATVQTACTSDFLSRIEAGDHLLLVADEVHRLGSPEFQTVLQIEAGGRLGLSATPKRAGDPDGTRAIFSYFGDVLEPRFTLSDGIETKRLCAYEYYVHLVYLDEDEREQWAALSNDIAQAYAREGGDSGGPLSERLKFLLIQRARIAKQARKKVREAAKIVQKEYKQGQHWLLYCDDQSQLGSLLALLRLKGLDALEYHSAMSGDRDATLDRYRQFGGILVAIRCLDEGVDIPDITHAVILASSRNPREFIQRRGRLLRRADGKFGAVIHDLLIAPPDDDETERFTGLLRAELARAREFSGDALNRGTETYLDGLCIAWGIDPGEIKHIGVEED